MIRGRKEGSTYASWFIGFDHDDTFGLSPFPELPPQSSRTPVHNKPVSRATSLESLLPADRPRDISPVQRSLTPAATQTSFLDSKQISTQTTEETQANSPHIASTQTATFNSKEAFTETPDPVIVSRSLANSETSRTSNDLESSGSRRRRQKDTQDLYKEAFDGARRAEEFKFRVKFDKLIGDLHVAIEEKTQNGLTSVASPSYGDVMLTFKDKVKELLKAFTQRLQLAYESFGSTDSPESAGQKVKQNVSKVIEELIGETLDLTSDEAVSDLSSLSDDSTSEQNSFEDLIAQAVVSKLLENHRKEVDKTLRLSNDSFRKAALKDQGTETQDDVTVGTKSGYLPVPDHKDNNESHHRENVDDHNGFSNKQQREKRSSVLNGGNLSNSELFSSKSDLIPDVKNEEDETLRSEVIKAHDITNVTGNKRNTSPIVNGMPDVHKINGSAIENDRSDEETDIVKEFEQLKEFVKQTRKFAQPKIKAIPFDDSNLCEAKEETLHRTSVDRDESVEDFHTRYSVFDRVHNWEPSLPDFTQFENIDFASDELDPDLLSMNLAIIPEETEEELEQEEEEDELNQWKANWLFKGKGVSPYENMGKKTVNLDPQGSLYMMVPRPDDKYLPRIGHRDIDQLSEFSEHDLLGQTELDGSDDEENTYYADTSAELARISGQHKKHAKLKRLSSESHSDNSDLDTTLSRRKIEQLYERTTYDDTDSIHIPGPIVEPTKQELKLLQDLVPAENDDPKFLVAPESVTVQEGEPVKFTCRVAGTLPIDVFWYREGDEVEELEESEDVEILSSGDKNSIVLYNTSKKMAGQYMCIALSEKGKAIQYLVVAVKDNKQELKKPEFLKGLKDVEVTEGQSVKFRVKVKGYPPPRISWYKDGELLKNSKTCRLEKFGNRDYILTIDYASMNDDAEYTVSARNVAGEERMSAQVIVEPQSELPVRRQRISSNTTSGASDSESDRSVPRQSSGSILSATPVSRESLRDKESQLHINLLDRKVALAQTTFSEEAEKLKGISGKDEVTERKRFITADALEVLQAASEIIEHEKSTASHSPNDKINGGSITTPVRDITNNDKLASNSFSPDGIVEDLPLPDILEEYPSLNVVAKKLSNVTVFEQNLSTKGQPNNFSCRELSAADDKFKSKTDIWEQKRRINIPPAIVIHSDLSSNQNDADFNSASSCDSGRGSSLVDNPASASSSVISDPNSREAEEAEMALNISRQQMLKEQYSRDFEIPHTAERKKWQVSLDSFSPHAEIVNKQSRIERTNGKRNSVDINATGISTSSSLHPSREDSSSQSSSVRRHSVDSGALSSSKQKLHAPVHMVGHTTEDDVPESRTEFNTDGSIELPSVNRLKAMFSSSPDEDFGDGSFRRIHSITARNVPKEKLEKLRANNQNELSGKFLNASRSSSASSVVTHQQQNSERSSTTPSSSQSSFTVTLKPVQHSVDSHLQHHQKSFHAPVAGPYKDLDPARDPVLIYPEHDPEYMQHHTVGEVKTLTNSSKLTLQQQNHQQLNPNVKRMNAAPSEAPRMQQMKLNVQRALPNDETVKKSGPRIRSGCISARAAFWERRIVEGAAVQEEDFPEMVEDGET